MADILIKGCVTEFTVEDFGMVKMVIYHIIKAPTVLEANNGTDNQG